MVKCYVCFNIFFQCGVVFVQQLDDDCVVVESVCVVLELVKVQVFVVCVVIEVVCISIIQV